MGAASLIILILAAIAFSAGAILIAKLVTKATKNKQKAEPYECGIPTVGPSWIQFNVGWAVAAKQVGWLALIEIIIFFFILFMGFLYAHKKGALKWK
jgi:NADH:ubiquinone oxidoreductase subunit 3 (subunit A)